MAARRMYPDNLLHQVNMEGLTLKDLDFEYLTERERSVLLMHYRDRVSRKQLAEMYETSDQRMRQIISCAIRKLRKKASNK